MVEVEALKKYEQKWVECWQLFNELSKDSLSILLSCLARIPYSSDIKPPSIDACHAAVSLFLGKVKNAPDEERLEAVETIVNLVERLLQYEWNREKLDIQTALENILSDADDLLLSRNSAHRKVRDKIGLLFEEIEKPWKIKTLPPNVSWRQPTVAWLSKLENFQP